MPEYLYFDDNFTNSPATGSRALTYPTTPGAAESTTAVGNGWTDVTGGLWYIDSDNILTTPYQELTSTGYLTVALSRPTDEVYLSQRADISYAPGFVPPGSNETFVGVRMRVQPNGDHYLFNWIQSGVFLYKIIGGSLISIGSWGFFLSQGRQYQMSCLVDTPSGGASPISIIIYDITDGGGTNEGIINLNDNDANLQTEGYVQLTSWNFGTSTINGQVSRVQLYQGDVAPSPSLTVSPSTATAVDNGSAVSITATLLNSANALSASLSGLGTLSTETPTSGTPFTYNAPSSGSGTATVTVSEGGTESLLERGREKTGVMTGGLSATCVITYGPGASISISPTTVDLGVATPVTITGTSTSWTGTTLPTLSGNTGGGFGNITISGQVISAHLNPGTVAGTLTVGDTTDGHTTNVTAVSAPTINVVFHGDSLTYGTNSSSPGNTATARIAAVLNGLGPAATGVNLGTSGQTLTQMIAGISTVTSNYVNGMLNILVVQGGHNDYYNGGSFTVSSSDVESRISSYVAGVLAAKPWLIVWSTEPPASHPLYPGDFDSLRDASNAWLETNWRGLGIARMSLMHRDYRIGLSGCEKNATYFSNTDFTHLTDAGYAIWGEYDLAACSQAVALGAPELVSTIGRVSGQRPRYRR